MEVQEGRWGCGGCRASTLPSRMVKTELEDSCAWDWLSGSNRIFERPLRSTLMSGRKHELELLCLSQFVLITDQGHRRRTALHATVRRGRP